MTRIEHPVSRMGNDSIQSRYRWIMLFLLWLLYIAFGLVARSITPLITPILNDLHMTYSQMGFILGSWQLTYIMVALMAGAILDRWGVRKSIMGILVDVTGTFMAGTIFLAVLCIGIAILTFFIKSKI